MSPIFLFWFIVTPVYWPFFIKYFFLQSISSQLEQFALIISFYPFLGQDKNSFFFRFLLISKSFADMGQQWWDRRGCLGGVFYWWYRVFERKISNIHSYKGKSISKINLHKFCNAFMVLKAYIINYEIFILKVWGLTLKKNKDSRLKLY